jgi:type IV pilus assembly protein PilB
MLVAAGVIDEVQLNDALEVQKATGGQLGKVLVELGHASQSAILAILAEQIGIPFFDLAKKHPDPTAIAVVPRDLAVRYSLMPVGFDDRGRLMVAMADPQNVLALDDLRIITGYDCVPAIATRDDILATIEESYGAAERLSDRELVSDDLGGQEVDITKMAEVAADTPIVKLVNFIITKAVSDRASDIHVEPQENDLRVRYRVDGVLYEMMRSPKTSQAAIISRFKIMADMDIAENRKPQDGHASITVGHHALDLRVSTLPTVYGERVVLRILRKDSILMKLTDLGFLPQSLDRFETSFRKPYGAVLVTGPTGSGKSTTLYAAVNVLNEIHRHIITIEDPVEYRLAGVNQIQVHTRAGLTFATALRSFLRCSPDVILVGEIRDRETATIAIESALTGHMVLSTLHTNDSSSAVTRLIEMGVEPFLVSSSVACVLAQRLARRLCPECKQEYEPPKQMLLDAGYDPENLPATTWKAVGCRKCGGTGYRGRLGLHEVLLVTEEISHLTVTGGTADDIRRIATAQGMLTLRQDGLEKARLGETSIEEVSRVVI